MRTALLAGVAAAALALGGISAAYAGPITISGVVVPPGTVPFNLLNLGTSASSGMQSVTSPITTSGEIISFTGNSGVYSGDTASVAVSPFGAGSNKNYLAAEPGGSLNIAFASTRAAFNLLWGTVDNYNSLIFTFTGVSGSQTITGGQIAGAISGLVANGTQNAAVQIAGLDPFNNISVTSSSPAFEFVPGTPVPEPGSLALLGTALLGLGIVAGAMRRKAG